MINEEMESVSLNFSLRQFDFDLRVNMNFSVCFFGGACGFLFV